MKLTIVGSGDAFGTAGRSNTCFLLRHDGVTLAVDFGASALVSMGRLGIATTGIDAVVLSHLHGDHFGGLPFLLLESQFVGRRRTPLTIAGPVGLEARLRALCEAMFPDMWETKWGFALRLIETAPDEAVDVHGFKILGRAVDHPSGAVSRALRIAAGDRVFAYSGDTVWTDVLTSVAADADLFMVECSSGSKAVPYHIDWPILKTALPRLSAKRIMLTHMGADALARRAEMEAAGLLIADDGATFDI